VTLSLDETVVRLQAVKVSRIVIPNKNKNQKKKNVVAEYL